MKLAVVGATGLVGSEILEVIANHDFKYDELLLVASERSVGKKITYKGKEHTIIGLDQAVSEKPDIAIFSAGGGTSLDWAPKFAEAGTIVIDNSSAWRMDPSKKLVVPEINAKTLRIDDRIIANPNCSTIQMVLALAPLHEEYGIKRIVVSTYQSVTGTGKAAVDQMMAEREGREPEMVYPHKIDLNVLPHIDVFQENGYTKEEMKMIKETKKIFGNDNIQVTATTVRIPVMGGHSESVNVEFHQDFEMDEVRDLLGKAPGVILQDDPQNNVYPMPLNAHKKDEVFVGRLRRDESQPNTLNMWVVADNLRKGAATNAVQIAQYLVDHSLV
ncbi:aspartate-semialdehyde dehydrogenase [Litoribacter ruber]|uniref:Aspartate-semialdehyde dehydrogenase n=1 Tax=Litoribacter ruber TaxID=702568 RepID=A0AAP2CFI0_9BACT|nr:MULTISPECIES: aspartate-semialdehyde dehydrogenase [Litoribacter]MBS9523633.1 aspartate-semialdehyde dehydrogenase [Litoribacter alkaliphilus]MBT0812147.1 aspartate-semialdehyde dehydrogenase [Litoribacter ruber]